MCSHHKGDGAGVWLPVGVPDRQDETAFDSSLNYSGRLPGGGEISQGHF